MPERLEIPVGEQLQRPPAYSAVRIGGERAYALASRGETVETQERPVTVHRAELLSHEGERAEFEIECSAGTYVRTLIADLGDAYCEELERTAIGPFRLADADPSCGSARRSRSCRSGNCRQPRPRTCATAGAFRGRYR